jgi:uncharacterized protein (DUF885 family)
MPNPFDRSSAAVGRRPLLIALLAGVACLSMGPWALSAAAPLGPSPAFAACASITALAVIESAPGAPRMMPTAVRPRPVERKALVALLDEHVDALMRQSPTWATTRGDLRFNDRLEDLSPAAIERSRDEAAKRLARLNAMEPDASWTPADRLDADLLRVELERRLDAARFFEEQIPISDRNGPQVWLPQLGERVPLETDKHFADYVARLEAVPKLIDQHIEQMRAGLRAGRVPPKVVMGQAAGQARALAKPELADKPERSLFFMPLNKRPATDPLIARAKTAIAKGIVPAYARLAEFLDKEYVPACRDTIGASRGKDGLDYYNAQLRRHTTTNLTAQQTHDIGLREVAKIRAEMMQVIARSDFSQRNTLKGDELFNAFVEYLRTDPRFYFTDPKDLLRAYREIAKRIDPEVARLFGRLPRNPYGVREMPRFAAETAPTAYYYSGSLRAGLPGYFVANTYRLDQRPKYEMIALTLHEAVPGHHLQIALADEIEGVHPLRTLVSHTAFVEGWALYAETLGLEMGPPPRGLFEDPYDDFGRLTYQMWRATRLVVDTGIHALGWTRQQAIDYMAANTALSRLNIEREVDRYIGWPGQACAYMIGKLRIEQLRERARKALGERFDLRAFHDVVLGSGAVPLDVLEGMVDRWVAERQAKP